MKPPTQAPEGIGRLFERLTQRKDKDMDRHEIRETLARCLADRDIDGLRQLVKTLGEARDQALRLLDHEHHHFRHHPSAHNWRQLESAMLRYQDAHTQLSEVAAQNRRAIVEWNLAEDIAKWNLAEDIAINEAMRAAGYAVPDND